jgi:RNA polymerase sigma-70 factor (ECF subfamily)
MTDEVRREKFMALYEPVHLSFQRFCRTRTDSSDNAKDLIAETVLKAFEGLHRLRDEKAFIAFLFGIASRILKKQYRRKKFWGFFDDDRSRAMEDKRPTPEQDLDVQFLNEAIRQLPLMYQEAVTLHYISGFSLHEVAAIQGSTLSAVKLRLFRGKLRLKKILKITETNSSGSKDEVSFKIIP